MWGVAVFQRKLSAVEGDMHEARRVSRSLAVNIDTGYRMGEEKARAQRMEYTRCVSDLTLVGLHGVELPCTLCQRVSTSSRNASSFAVELLIPAMQVVFLVSVSSA